MKDIFQIVNLNSFQVIGTKIETTNQKKAGKVAIPKFWEAFKNQNLHEHVMPLMNQQPEGLLGLSIYNIDDSDARKFHYMIGVSSTLNPTSNVETYQVPASLWAVFPCTMDTIGKTEAMAITKWLPRSQYRALNRGYMLGKMKSGAPDIERYLEDGTVEIWIAVKPK